MTVGEEKCVCVSLFLQKFGVRSGFCFFFIFGRGSKQPPRLCLRSRFVSPVFFLALKHVPAFQFLCFPVAMLSHPNVTHAGGTQRGRGGGGPAGAARAQRAPRSCESFTHDGVTHSTVTRRGGGLSGAEGTAVRVKNGAAAPAVGARRRHPRLGFVPPRMEAQ